MKHIKLYENFNESDFKLIFKIKDEDDKLSAINDKEATEALFIEEYNGFRDVYSYYDKNNVLHKFKINISWDKTRSTMFHDIVTVSVKILEGDKDILKEGLSKDLKGKYYYDYDLSTTVYLNFLNSINELNHQTPDSNNVNSPGFGQGAHYGNWGVDYGNPSKGVRGHFGEKGDKTDPNLPQKDKGYDSPIAIYDPVTDQLLHEDDVQDLIRRYGIKAKQKSETPLKFNNINSNTIKFIRNYLQE